MKNINNRFLFNLAIILGICGLIFVAFFALLNRITRHGSELRVPILVGKNINEAVSQLKIAHFDVSVDSAYDPAAKSLTVLKQMPDTGSIVKEGRTMFLTVNMTDPKTVAMPALVNLTYESAKAILQGSKLQVGETTLQPSVIKNVVLQQFYRGRPVRKGEPIPQGSRINLAVGDGLGNKQFEMPDVTNMTVDMASTILSLYNLQIEIMAVDNEQKITDTSEATVRSQAPEYKKMMNSGDKVVLYVE